MAGNLLQLVVGLDPVVTGRRHAPGGARVLFQHLEAVHLAFLGKVKPELQNQRALVDQHAFEAIDVVELIIQRRTPHGAGDALGDRLRIP